MKSGFNHRKIISVTTMLIALLLLISVYGCRTSKNIVEKSKESIIKSEIKTNKVDSIVKIDKLIKIDNSFQSKQSEFKHKYDISFNGLTNDDVFEFQLTENGFTAKGKGSVNNKSEINKKDSTLNNKIDSFINEKTSVKSDSKNQNKINESKFKADKFKENKSTGFNWNFTIILIIGIVVALILFWKFGLPKFNR